VKLSGFDQLIKRLETYDVQERQKRLLTRLAEIGIDVADVKFKTAQYDGVNDVVVKGTPTWVDDNTILLEATGHAVAFIEFGTGVYYPEQHPYAERMGAKRGGFGKGRGKQMTWGYYGAPGTHGIVHRKAPKGDLVLTHGNPPARAMYEAGKEIKARLLEVVKEVYGI
jgi:hypothetical protein